MCVPICLLYGLNSSLQNNSENSDNGGLLIWFLILVGMAVEFGSIFLLFYLEYEWHCISQMLLHTDMIHMFSILICQLTTYKSLS